MKVELIKSNLLSTSAPPFFIHPIEIPLKGRCNLKIISELPNSRYTKKVHI